MKPSQFFTHCPRCGARQAAAPTRDVFQCDACNFAYYFNPALAVAGILRDNAGRMLLIERAREPAKGKLALPGGFVDIGETAEGALRREIKEEVNLEVGTLEFLCSRTNHYEYREVTYPLVDLFFLGRVNSIDHAVALDEVASLHWIVPDKIDLDQIAFPSIREALQLYISRR